MGSQASINPITAIIAVCLAVVVFILPRKYLLVPVMLTACFLPADQRFMLDELDFPVIRVIVIALAVRLLVRGEIAPLRMNVFDKLFIAWMVAGTVVYILQWLTIGAVIYKCGRWVEVGGLYWVFRQTIRSWNDIGFAFVVLAVCALGLLPFAVYESATGSNPFAVLGRVHTVVREGEYRCQASFPHSIIFGLFWAVNVPMFAAFVTRGWCRTLFALAIAASVFMVFATASSTPLGTLMAAVFVLAMYKGRHYTRSVGWTVVAMLTALHLIMSKPVWHLLARVRFISGSTGYHRYHLIDQAMRRLNEWILLGCRSTAHWGYGLFDVTNQYIAEGVLGGLVTLVLFVVMIYKASKVFLVGSLNPAARKYCLLYWCLFATMMAHCVAFLGVSYFGQISILWYMVLATAAFFYDQEAAVKAPAVAAARPRREAGVDRGQGEPAGAARWPTEERLA